MASPGVSSSLPEHQQKQGSSCSCCSWFAKVWNGYVRGLQKAVHACAAGCGHVGSFVSKRPVVTIIATVVVAAALAAGGWIGCFRMENDAEKLWVPSESKAKTDQDWVKEQYGTSGDGCSFLASVKSDYTGVYGENALQLGIVWEMFQVHQKVMAISVESDGRKYSFTDICFRDSSGQCNQDGFFSYWNMSFPDYLASVGGSPSNPLQGDRRALIQDVNVLQFPNGGFPSVLSIFGGVNMSSDPLGLMGAEVITVEYNLQSTVDSGAANDWFNAYLDVLEAAAANATYTRLDYMAGNSVSDEIGRSVTKDMYLIVISVLIFIVVAIIGLSRLDAVRTRTSLGLLGVLAAALAVLAAYGLSLIMAQPFTTLQQVLPYVLLGVAVDVMFILVKAWDVMMAHPDAPSWSLPEAFGLLMEGAGLSVAVTLLASAVAFALGATSELPSIRWFSVYATLSVVAILIVSFTIFIALFALTERRIHANRYDCACCCVSSSASTVPGPGSKAVGENGGQVVYGIAVSSQQVSTAAVVPPEVQQVTSSDSRPGSSASSSGGVSRGAVPDVADLGSGKVATAAATATPRAQDVAVAVKGPSALGDADSSAPAPHQEPLFKMLFRRYYAPLLTWWPIKILVLLIFIGWAVLSFVGIPRLGEGQPMQEIAPDDSYLQGYANMMDATYKYQTGNPFKLYFRDIDPSKPQVQVKMLRSLDLVLQNEFVNSTVSAFSGNWLISLLVWAQATQPATSLVQGGCYNPFEGKVTGVLSQYLQLPNITACIKQEAFYPLLNQFLADPQHEGFKDDIEMTPAPGTEAGVVVTGMYSSRFPAVHSAEGDNDQYAKQLINSMRDVEGQVNGQIFEAEDSSLQGPDPYVFFVFSGQYIYAEGDALLGKMTWEYALLAIIGVGVVMAIMLVHPLACLMMMVAVGLVDLFLFGEMFVFGIRFNQVSVINMIMATGLAVDYSVYFAQKFMATTGHEMHVLGGSSTGMVGCGPAWTHLPAAGSRDMRVRIALADTGSAVFMGGLTALLGVIPLAFSSSVILRTFFALIFGTIIFALLVGLMLMPVLFSLIGPPPLAATVPMSTKPKAAEGGDNDMEMGQQQAAV